MNWKDLLNFSRSERNGIFVFAVLLILIILTPLIHKEFFISERKTDPEAFESFKKEIIAFEKHLERIRKDHVFSDKTINHHQSDEIYVAPIEIVLSPFKFDPNNLSEEKWLKMGMPARVVRNIKNFEAAGGSFQLKEDLKRLYLMTDEIYYQLEPYIELPAKDIHKKEYEETVKSIAREPAKPLVVDINTADTLELMKIRGIGPYFSNQIVLRRQLLGGYITVEQLKDIFGMDKDRFESIKEYITIKDTNIRKININKAGFDDMLQHPYFDLNLVNNLIQMREQHGKFKSVEDMKKSHLIDDDLFTLIAPYIKVE